MLDFEFLSKFATEAVFRELVLLCSGRKHNSSGGGDSSVVRAPDS